ncbi:hypothetical protein MUB24_10615 [Lederbergia sp. NSJ-179]|uniref:hypothetical protein n=1 Tax=Lederbergia sp. NSJ-179 TaxID=2931402 RepID=UPI001FD17FF5|nr:hypothetical protein [Lederbergia sp. NSJ-179]MCJ7841345.1 hypothetical protein [Lederbergia sp. NSJ-179]
MNKGLYHHDIFAIGVVVNVEELLGQESKEQLQKELEASFGFTAVVDSDKNNIRKKLLQNAIFAFCQQEPLLQVSNPSF